MVVNSYFKTEVRGSSIVRAHEGVRLQPGDPAN